MFFLFSSRETVMSGTWLEASEKRWLNWFPRRRSLHTTATPSAASLAPIPRQYITRQPHSASFTLWKHFSHVIFRLLATCSADQTCKIWRTSNFSLMTELSIKSNNPGETSRGWMWDCAFSGDSQYIVTGQSKTSCKRNCNLIICF